jgi:hypothetical protein
VPFGSGTFGGLNSIFHKKNCWVFFWTNLKKNKKFAQNIIEWAEK